MAVIENRSRFVVTVRNADKLTKHFPFSSVAAVEAYRDELRAERYKPKVSQLDEHWLVRIRQTGYKPLQMSFGSLEAAESFVKTVEAERERGVFIDYTTAHTTTFAELLVRYLRDEAPRHKSKDLLARQREYIRTQRRRARPHGDGSQPRCLGRVLRTKP